MPQNVGLRSLAGAEWLVANIQLLEDGSAADIDAGSLRLVYGGSYLEPEHSDLEGNTLRVYFNRAAVDAWLQDLGVQGEQVLLTITGEIITEDGPVPFSASNYYQAAFEGEEEVNFSLSIEGPATITIPVEGEVTETYTAVVLDAEGQEVPDLVINWSLEGETAGVTVADGLVMVTSEAVEGSFTLTAALVGWEEINDTIVVQLLADAGGGIIEAPAEGMLPGEGEMPPAGEEGPPPEGQQPLAGNEPENENEPGEEPPEDDTEPEDDEAPPEEAVREEDQDSDNTGSQAGDDDDSDDTGDQDGDDDDDRADTGGQAGDDDNEQDPGGGGEEALPREDDDNGGKTGEDGPEPGPDPEKDVPPAETGGPGQESDGPGDYEEETEPGGTVGEDEDPSEEPEPNGDAGGDEGHTEEPEPGATGPEGAEDKEPGENDNGADPDSRGKLEPGAGEDKEPGEETKTGAEG